MSDCLINVRVMDWHFQLTKAFRPRLTRNRYHRDKGWPDGYFAVYEFKPFK